MNNLRKKQSFKDLIFVLKQSKIPWILVAFTLVVNLLYNDLLYKLPVSTGKLIGGDLSNEALKETLLYFFLYSLIVVIQGIVQAFSVSITTKKARGQLWGKMLTIREDYYDQIDQSDMLSAVTNDLGSSMSRIVYLLVTFIPDIWYIIRALATISDFHFLLMVTIIVFFPLKYIYMIVFGRLTFTMQSNMLEKIGNLTSRLGERMENLHLIKSFNKEEEELKNGEETIKELYKANVNIGKIDGLSIATSNIIDLAQQFITLIIGVLLLQQGKITAAEWVTFFLFVNNLTQKFGSIITDWLDLKQIHGSLVRPTVLYRAEDEDFVEDGIHVDTLDDYPVVFDHVSFSYESDDALQDISFTIPYKNKVAIVGNCGSGKSTTLSLLERFYTPKEGTIRINGKDINTMKLKEYRDMIAYVPQNNQVFTSSIKDVLRYGNTKDISDEMLLEASKKTEFIDYINLQSEGLNTTIFNGGENMSGGQLQRMIITRELLKDSKIVLFDEPTSALDAVSSNTIKNMIMKDFKDKTVIVVTHDLSLTDEMDQIIVLDDGHLVSIGTYDELMETCETFKQLVESQNTEMEGSL